jgi:hypothetical protein
LPSGIAVLFSIMGPVIGESSTGDYAAVLDLKTGKKRILEAGRW